jgi:hypothetical protein
VAVNIGSRAATPPEGLVRRGPVTPPCCGAEAYCAPRMLVVPGAWLGLRMELMANDRLLPACAAATGIRCPIPSPCPACCDVDAVGVPLSESRRTSAKLALRDPAEATPGEIRPGGAP